uniref:Uncharacterized protein n=1 Tax=Cacopsylla melanoneura TaxID=428564 RepID=A0A8D9FJD1_9HEMI
MSVHQIIDWHSGQGTGFTLYLFRFSTRHLWKGGEEESPRKTLMLFFFQGQAFGELDDPRKKLVISLGGVPHLKGVRRSTYSQKSIPRDLRFFVCENKAIFFQQNMEKL